MLLYPDPGSPMLGFVLRKSVVIDKQQSKKCEDTHPSVKNWDHPQYPHSGLGHQHGRVLVYIFFQQLYGFSSYIEVYDSFEINFNEVIVV